MPSVSAGTLGVDEDALQALEQLRQQVEADFDEGLIDDENVRAKLMEELNKANHELDKDESADHLWHFVEKLNKETYAHITTVASPETSYLFMR